MLRFRVFQNGAPAKSLSLEGAHLLGTDRVPLRAEIRFVNGEVICEPKARGAAALAMMWPVKGLTKQAATGVGAGGLEFAAPGGRMMLETTRLIERSRPYILNVELARGQLMRISMKREDWGLFDYAEGTPVYQQVDRARDLLVAAITAQNEAKASELGDAAIAASVRAGEVIAAFHADVFLKRRITEHKMVKRPLGCRIDMIGDWQKQIEPLSQAFDFALVPFSWRTLEPTEGKYQPEAIEQCVQALRIRKMPIWGQSLLAFDRALLPEWLPTLADDYEQIRERAARQIKYVLKQFGAHVRAWEVIGGIHASNAFKFSFEQIMDLTRMATILIKQMSPRSKAVIGIVLPWGEYYATDPRTIPPPLYAEMAVESGINFDAFGLEMQFGAGDRGLYVRDLLQISALLDRFGTLGKPLHITAAGVPSSGGSAVQGSWRGPWSDEVQSLWLREFYRMALSKPFVETVTWRLLTDQPASKDFGGLLGADLSPKKACAELKLLHQELRAGVPRTVGGATPEIDI